MNIMWPSSFCGQCQLTKYKHNIEHNIASTRMFPFHFYCIFLQFRLPFWQAMLSLVSSGAGICWLLTWCWKPEGANGSKRQGGKEDSNPLT